jgi:hypothetical protein
MNDAPESPLEKPHKHALDSPFALLIFIITSLGVAPYNWFLVVGTAPILVVTITSIAFLYGAALTSIPAGAAFKRFSEKRVHTLPRAVSIYTVLLFIFVGESLALPPIRIAWEKSVWLSMLSGSTVIVQLLVTSYLQKIVWDRAVKLIDEQAV